MWDGIAYCATVLSFTLMYTIGKSVSSVGPTGATIQQLTSPGLQHGFLSLLKTSVSFLSICGKALENALTSKYLKGYALT